MAEATPELQAAYQRGYEDCALSFLEKLVEGARVLKDGARRAADASRPDEANSLMGGGEALIAFAGGYVSEAKRRNQDSGQQQGTRVSQDNPGPAPSASIGGETTPSNPTGSAAGNVTESRDGPERDRVVGPAAGRATSGGAHGG